MTNTEINRYEKENKTQGEITMNNTQNKRYEKAIELVNSRDDLNRIQKECYKQYLSLNKEFVGELLDADNRVTITLKTKSGKTIVTGEGDADFSSIENRLLYTAIDYVLAFPICRQAEKKDSWRHDVYAVEYQGVNFKTNEFETMQDFYRIERWTLSPELKSWNVKVNR